MGGPSLRLLDLFCGAGGAAMGYSRAGFTEIVGVDIVPQPNYPFTFVQADALQPPMRLEGFDLIHASPPCQAYSTALTGLVNVENYESLLEDVRLLVGDHPHVIENVPGAPMPAAAVLCGTAVGLKRVWRHRLFETSWFVMTPPCVHDGWPLNPYKAPSRKRDGIEKRAMQHYARAMGINWISSSRMISEAIPPAYTQFIGEQFLASG